MKPFENEPILELRRAPVRARLDEALREHDARPPLKVPVWIGEDQRHGDELVSTDPGKPERVVATAAKATEADVDAALQAAQRGSKALGRDAGAGAGGGPGARRAVAARAPPGGRRAGRARVREAVARGRRATSARRSTSSSTTPAARWTSPRAPRCCRSRARRTRCAYAPRGVVAVISPWNFPLAIPLGMVSAGLATGNAVVLKPAEQSPGCALMIFRALREARRAARRGVAAARRGRRRRRARQGPARAHDRLHGLGRGRAGDRARGRAAAPGPEATSSA